MRERVGGVEGLGVQLGGEEGGTRGREGVDLAAMVHTGSYPLHFDAPCPFPLLRRMPPKRDAICPTRPNTAQSLYGVKYKSLMLTFHFGMGYPPPPWVEDGIGAFF